MIVCVRLCIVSSSSVGIVLSIRCVISDECVMMLSRTVDPGVPGGGEDTQNLLSMCARSILLFYDRMVLWIVSSVHRILSIMKDKIPSTSPSAWEGWNSLLSPWRRKTVSS